MVRGYGPEEYVIRKVVSGTYEIKVRVFTTRGRAANQDIAAKVNIYTHYGDPKREREAVYVIRLNTDKEVVPVATVVF